MIINKLTLNNFRNIKQLNISFTRPITILYGDNGQGKTNIVESIYLLSSASSFRTSYFKEMINNNSDEAVVEGEIDSNKRNEKYKVLLKKAGKTVLLNDIVINKLSDYVGKIKTVCFSPEDVSLFKDSPGIRRTFLDKELSALFPVYLKQLILFKNALEQRNSLLKDNVDSMLLEVIDDKLIETSYDVYKRRKWLISKLEEFATNIYKKLTNENQSIKITYQTFLDEFNQKEYFDKARNVYKNSFKKDKEKMYTNYGIHKDDFKVYLNDYQIDMYASQGQQRLISLCLKLAVVEIISKANKQEPIIILDDAFSELDASKKEKLMDYVITKNQVFITCTDYKNIIHKDIHHKIMLVNIKDGKVLERSLI